MPIKRVDVKGFLVFKGELTADFCPGVNVLIGGNGTGKTTLLKTLYMKLNFFDDDTKVKVDSFKEDYKPRTIHMKVGSSSYMKHDIANCVYIPEKDILEHAKGLLPFIERKQTGFGQVYKDVLLAAQDVPTQEQSETQKSVGQKISAIIGGDVRWDKGDGSFYTLKKDGSRIPFSNEASGYKKFGFLGLLVSSGQLEPGSVLFWDEPENSLNPELVPVLVDILLELAKNGVQIFIATHDYNIARYFDVRKDKSISVLFHNMTRSDHGQIICRSESEYIKLPNNLLESASADLFEAVVADAMEVQEDE